MARRLFGTDGVRGVAGELLSADLAVKLGRAATLQSGNGGAARPRDPRHARERRDARGGAGGRRRRGRRRRLPRRRPADARPRRCCSAATASTSPRSSPPRTTPTATTASSSSAPTASSSPTRPRRRSRTLLDESRRRPTAIGRIRALHGTEEDYLRELHTRFADLDLARRRRPAGLRQRRHLRGGARRSSGAWARGHGDRRHARRPQHQRGLRLDARRRARRSRSPTAATTSASPSTATATASSPSTATASSSTATS